MGIETNVYKDDGIFMTTGTEKDKNRILFLMCGKGDIDQLFLNSTEQTCADIYPIYRYNSGILWKIEALWIEKMKLPFQTIWYGKWKGIINQYDVIIVINRNFNWSILKYFKKKNGNARVIAWYWDTVNHKNLMSKKYRDLCEVWSFDKEDCNKYNFHENVQFYLKTKVMSYNGTAYDAIFIGKDKGRYHIASTIRETLNENGITTFVRIVKDKTSKYRQSALYGQAIPYFEMLGMIQNSKCIIDIVKDGQYGITMRVLEALFYEKKLITTNTAIINEDFYNPSNIMIWDTPSKQAIQDFFAKPYVPVPEEIVNKYTFESWLRNFGITYF